MATATVVQPTLNFTVRKSNRLVEARYRLTIWETRVFTKLVSVVKSSDEDYKKYRIYFTDFLRDFDLSSSNASYKELRSAANTLTSKQISIFEETKDGPIETRTNLILAATTQMQDSSGNYIELSFHPKIRPHIDKLREKFTTYDVKNILNLSSTYSIRIFELLKRHEFRTTWTSELDEFKEMIGARESIRNAKGKMEIKDPYALYGNFNQKILKKAQLHLAEHTDICFEYEPIKKGRKVDRLKFTILPNPRIKHKAGSDKTSAADNKTVDDTTVHLLHNQVKDYVDEAALRKWLGEYSAQHVQLAIDYTQRQINKGRDIKNVGGYLHQILKSDFLTKADAKQQAKKEKEQAKETARLELLGNLQAEYDLLEQRTKAKVQEVSEGIFDREPDAKRDAFETASRRRGSGYSADRTKAENMQDATFRAMFITIVRKRFPDYFSEVKKMEKEASRLRSKLNRLS